MEEPTEDTPWFMETSKDLLPCPFCGKAPWDQWLVPGRGARQIWCGSATKDCPKPSVTGVDATRMWNTRRQEAV